MLRKTAGVMAAVLAAGWVLCGPGLAADVDKAELDKAFTALPKYDWGQSRDALNKIDAAIVASHGKADVRKGIEKRLAGALKGDATRAAKQYCCRKLAIIGTADSVGALSPLLTSAELSHMGRYALERMACPGAAKAMRDALGKVSGKLKVGMINSLGMREDAQAVAAITPLLKDADAQIAAAAAAALGRIGAAESAKPLADFLASAPKKLQSAAIDASLDFAQRLGKKGKADEAAKIYQKLDAPGQPPRVRRAALQGLVMVRPAESTPLLLKALASDDAAMRGLAVRMVKETKGTDATKAFAGSLSKLSPAGQIALLDALQARKDAAAKPAVLAATRHGDANVRAAALKALSTLGETGDVPMLAKTAAANKDPESAAARGTLARMGAKGTNEAIVSALGGSEAPVRTELLRALAARAATKAAPTVAKSAEDADQGVRQAAIEALGTLGDETQMPLLVRLVKAPKSDRDRGTIDKAMTAIASRVRQKAAACLIGGLQGADGAAAGPILTALARAGGADALAAVVKATGSADDKIKDGAIRALCTWTTPDAMAPLLKIASTSSNKVHQVLALRAYVDLARANKAKNPEQIQRLKKALELAKGAGEKKRVLGALGEVRTIESFKIVAPFVNEKGLTEDAGAVATRIAGDDRVWRNNKDFVRSLLLDVVKNVKNRRTKRDAQRIIGRIGPKKP